MTARLPVRVTVVDDHFRDRTVFAADLFHPARAGHALWAEAALPGLSAALAATNP